MNDIVYDTLLGAAIKAPSGHNSQPWLFSLSADGSGILVQPDYSRRLPVLDPHDRELYISIGCAVENMCVAATGMGLSGVVRMARDGGVLVSFNVNGDVAPSELIAAIERRHTNRNEYDGTEIPQQVADLLVACDATLYARGAAQFCAVRDSIVEADNVIYGDSRSRGELKGWIRHNRKETESMMDGLGYDVLGIPGGVPTWVSRMATSMALKAQVQSRSDVRKLMSSPVVAAFAAPDDVEGWVQCGRRLQRFLLTAAMHGVACAFMCQPCEVDGIAASLTSQLGLPGRVQVLLRIGHAAPPPAYSRRRPLASFKK